MLLRRILCALLLFSVFGLPAIAASPPKLVVFIVVDQLRGDMLGRVEDRLAPGGFRYFMDEGVWFQDASYRHGVTFTAVGHASLATGGNAPQHGMTANDWFDPEAGKPVYCLEDAAHYILHRAPKLHSGTSPKNLLVPTWSDVLVEDSGGASRVFSVAIKDRGAIATAGHEGTAFWYESGTGQFVTSTYYYRQYPAWAAVWNAEEHAKAFHESSWELMHARDSYFAQEDDRPVEKDLSGLGKIFPHDLKKTPAAFRNSALRFTPFGTELTLHFARTLLKAERLGIDEHTDVLNVGLSVADYIGHTYGPESLEYEDNLLQMDRALQDFFAFLDQAVGLEDTLIVLSADHGSYEVPWAVRSQREKDGLAPPDDWKAKANEIIQSSFGITGDFVMSLNKPWFYLDEAALKDAGVSLDEASASLAEGLARLPGVRAALTRAQIENGDLPVGPLGDRIRLSYHPERCGHVTIAPKQGWDLFYKLYGNPGEHGSPWSYDRHVPVLFAGPGIKAQRMDRAVAPEDIAPTLTDYLGLPRPSGATGDAYPEILGTGTATP